VPELPYLLDTGPLVAYLSPRDEHHWWARQIINALDMPLYTCEAVVTEAFFLLSDSPNGFDVLATFCESAALRIDFDLIDVIGPVRELLNKYRNIPMDLADACLVHLADHHRSAAVITTDRDFLLYRTKSRRVIPLIAPFVPSGN
jgi:predicted nucleic acid-binding protein